jgi:hypothetical protein
MSGGSVIAIIGLTFSMVAIRLMMVIENAQVVVVGVIGQQLPKKHKAIVFAIGAKKFYVLKICIVFFGKISSLIFVLQEMEIEKTVQGAASTMMNTILISNKMVSDAATKYTKHAVKKVKKRIAHHYNNRNRQ